MTQTKAELLQTRHQGDIRLGDADSTHYVGFKAPATVSSSLVWTLPAADGTAGYYLKTDGSGNLGWSIDNSGVSLSGSTNNTIATVTGANALQGEANLTFDGSELKLPTGSGTQGLFFQASSGSNANLRGVGTNYGELGFFIGNSEKFRLDSSGRLLVGHTADIGYGFRQQLVGTDGNTSSSSQMRFTASASGSTFVLAKSRNGTPGSKTIVQSGDNLGEIQFRGDDGVDYMSIASSIKGEVDGTPGAGDMPGRLIFSTTADGAESATERMRIDSSGRVAIGFTSFNDASEFLLVGSTTSAANISIVGNNSDHSSLNLGDEDDFNIQKIRSNHTDNSLVFFTNNTAALTLDSSQNATFASAIYGPAKTVGALELDLSTGNYFIKTISGNSTFTFANPAASGTVTAFTLELTHSSGTVTWPASVKWNADTAPTLTTGKTHLFMFVTDDGGSRYRGSALVDYVN